MSAQEHSKPESSSYISYTVYLEKSGQMLLLTNKQHPLTVKNPTFEKFYEPM